MRIKLSAAVTVIAAISTTATLITVKMKCVAHEYSVNLLKLATVYHTHKTMVNKLNFISTVVDLPNHIVKFCLS